MIELFTVLGPFQLHMFRVRSKIIMPHSNRKITHANRLITFHVENGASIVVVAANMVGPDEGDMAGAVESTGTAESGMATVSSSTNPG